MKNLAKLVRNQLFQTLEISQNLPAAQETFIQEEQLDFSGNSKFRGTVPSGTLQFHGGLEKHSPDSNTATRGR